MCRQAALLGDDAGRCVALGTVLCVGPLCLYGQCHGQTIHNSFDPPPQAAPSVCPWACLCVCLCWPFPSVPPSILLPIPHLPSSIPNPSTAEIVLRSCTSLCGADGSALPLDAAKRAELEAYITSLARQSLRAISLAHRVVSEGGGAQGKGAKKKVYEPPEDMEDLEAELTLDAIVGITVRAVMWGWDGVGWDGGLTESVSTHRMTSHSHGIRTLSLHASHDITLPHTLPAHDQIKTFSQYASHETHTHITLHTSHEWLSWSLPSGPVAAGGDGGGAAVPAGRYHGAHGHGRQRRDGQGAC